MLARTLTLECPRGQTGKETIPSDGPTRLPEARRAIQAGKLPRKAGLILVRHDNQYELTLQAETLAVSGASCRRRRGTTSACGWRSASGCCAASSKRSTCSTTPSAGCACRRTGRRSWRKSRSGCSATSAAGGAAV